MWSRCSWSHILGMACLPLSKTCWEWQASCEALRARSPACTFPLVEVLQLETLTMMVWILEPKLKSWTRIEPELSLIQLDCHSLKEWQKDQASCWILHKCKFLRRLCAIFSLREVAWMAWKDKRKEVERCSLRKAYRCIFYNGDTDYFHTLRLMEVGCKGCWKADVESTIHSELFSCFHCWNLNNLEAILESAPNSLVQLYALVIWAVPGGSDSDRLWKSTDKLCSQLLNHQHWHLMGLVQGAELCASSLVSKPSQT